MSGTGAVAFLTGRNIKIVSSDDPLPVYLLANTAVIGHVIVDSSPTSGATGSAVPSSASYSGVNVAGNLRGAAGLSTGSIFPAAVAIVDASGNQLTTFGTSKSGTGTESNVASSASDVTILAANSNRLGASVFNDSTAILYLLNANATSSATNYSTQIQPNGYYEVPFNYTGVLKGIWASANGNARVMEYT